MALVQHDSVSSSKTPSRQKVSLASKCASWTDRIDDQRNYATSVHLRQAFNNANNALTNNNSNKSPTGLRAVCLKSRLFGRAKDLYYRIQDEKLLGWDGVSTIVEYIYQRDDLSVVREAYRSFNALLNTSRNNYENMKCFDWDSQLKPVTSTLNRPLRSYQCT